MGAGPKMVSAVDGKRQQSASEFMTTYAWAILLIAIVVSLLYFFVIAPYSIAPSSCSFVAQLACEDVVLGTNTLGQSTTLILLVTNSQQYPLNGIELYASINGANTSSVSCSPSFVPAGGQFICQLPLPSKTNVNTFLSGSTYVNASYCGFSPTYSASSCQSPQPVTYAGGFSAKAQPLFSATGSSISVALTSNTSAQYLNAPVTLNATVRFQGSPLRGAVVTFTTNSAGPVITPKYATTNGAGSAYSQIESPVAVTAIVSANALGSSSNSISITFSVAPPPTTVSTTTATTTVYVSSTSTTSTTSTSTTSTTSTSTTSTSTTSTSTTSTSTTTIHYVPITLTNSQSSATPSPFQQMIVVPSSTYSSYINSNWNNVEFTTGAGATGSTLQAWVESNASNTASATVVWVKLTSSISGSGGTQTIYMDFMPSSVLSSSGPTGEAPTLSSTYGQYDNGGSVFPYYQAFGGLSSLPSGWSNSGASISYNSTSIGISSTYNPGWGNVYFAIPSCCKTAPEILDMYGNQGLTTGSYGTAFGFSGTTNIAGGSNPAFLRSEAPGSSSYFSVQGTGSATSTVLVAKVYSVTSIQVNSTNMTFYYNYKRNTAVASSTSALTYIVAGSPSPTSYVYWTWIRMRPAPPNGVMPSVSFGSVH